MGYWHPSMAQDFGKLRAEQLIREAEEWRAAVLAPPSVPRERRGFALAPAWWRALFRHWRVARVPLAEKEQI